jgi:hypothetical protein
VNVRLTPTVATSTAMVAAFLAITPSKRVRRPPPRTEAVVLAIIRRGPGDVVEEVS